MSKIAIRREDKLQERRSPIPPAFVKKLADEGVEVIVQSADHRIFSDQEYRDAGAKVVDSLDDQQLICGIKEIPLDKLEAKKDYFFFTHTIKGQPENMPLLAKLMELKCTAIDFERIVDEKNRRLVFFGWYAGVAGAIDALWSLGKRWAEEGHSTPLATLKAAQDYQSIDEAKSDLKRVGQAILAGGMPKELSPLVIGTSGTGNTAQGAKVIFDALGAKEMTPEELPAVKNGEVGIYQSYFDVHHLVERHEGPFNMQEYFEHPYRYDSIFAKHLSYLTVMMNCVYWDTQYPRLITIRDLNRLYFEGKKPKLEVIGDVSCDIRGGVEATLKATWPDDPVFVFDPDTATEKSGFSGKGPAIVAVYNLPAELPKDASMGFGEMLFPFIKGLVNADLTGSLKTSGLPEELKRAVIVYQGELTEDYQYLKEYINL